MLGGDGEAVRLRKPRVRLALCIKTKPTAALLVAGYPEVGDDRSHGTPPSIDKTTIWSFDSQSRSASRRPSSAPQESQWRSTPGDGKATQRARHDSLGIAKGSNSRQ